MLDIKFIEDVYLPSILSHKGINYFPITYYKNILKSFFNFLYNRKIFSTISQPMNLNRILINN